MGPLTNINQTLQTRAVFDSKFLYIENQHLFRNFFGLRLLV